MTNLDSAVTFTYRELIDAFDKWDRLVNSGGIARPNGDTIGVMLTNYLITTVNSARQEALTTYNK